MGLTSSRPSNPHPPKVRLSFNFSSPTCHVSGSPPFLLYAHLRNDGLEPITLFIGPGPLNPATAFTCGHFHFFDTATGRRMKSTRTDPVRVFDTKTPPNPKDFLTLEPQQSHTIEYVLADHWPPIDAWKHGNFEHRHTADVEQGRNYVMRFTEYRIGWWAWGRKKAVMKKAKRPAGWSQPPPGFDNAPEEIVLRAENEGYGYRFKVW